MRLRRDRLKLITTLRETLSAKRAARSYCLSRELSCN